MGTTGQSEAKAKGTPACSQHVPDIEGSDTVHMSGVLLKVPNKI